MKLLTERLLLREIKESDSNYLVEGLRDKEVVTFLEAVPFPYSVSDANWFINKCKENANNKQRENYEFAICLKNNPTILIGVISLTKINYFHEKCSMGYWLNEKFQRKGYMFEASKKVIEFAFKNLKLNKIEISAAVKNIASNNLIKKLGFVFEGTKKKSMKSKVTKEIFDVNFYGFLKENFIN